MKKIILGAATLITAAASLCAAPTSSSQYGQPMQSGMTPDCSQLTPEEQNFAAQIMDMNNRMMFCSQFSAPQRQQAMQMMGQPDDSGNIMNADQSVMKVSTMSGMTPRAGGGCPVK